MTEHGDERALPAGWIWTQVEDVGDVQLGRQRSPKHHQGEHMRPYLRVANVFEDRIDTSDVKEMNFTPKEFERYELKYGDILLNEGQSPELVGRPAMFMGEVEGACFQNTLVRFRADEDQVDRKYALYYFLDCLHSGRFTAIASQTVNIAHLGARRFSEMDFPLAPPEEQHRIVDKIEELFSDLDAGVQALETARRQLDRYRQSVLKAAAAGNLTAAWRAQHGAGDTGDAGDAGRGTIHRAPAGGATAVPFEPADALLDRILAERRARWEADYAAKYEAKGKTPPKGWQSRYKEPQPPDTDDLPDLPEGWVWVSAEQLGDVVTGSTPSTKREDFYGEGHPFYKPTDLEAGYYTRSATNTLTDLGLEAARHLPAGSTLVTCIGATIGKTGFIRESGACNQQVNAIVPVPAVDASYVYFACVSPPFQRQIFSNASSTTLPILNKSRFSALVLPLPPLAEQEAIVEEVERRLSVVDAVAAEVDRQLARADRLRRAILKHAFEGKLVPQEVAAEADGAAQGAFAFPDPPGDPPR
jgi:type I restriction enzyme S subunit